MIDLSDLHAIDRSRYHIPGVFSVYNVPLCGAGSTIYESVDRLSNLLAANPFVDRSSIIFVFNAQGGAFLGFRFTDGDRPAEHDDHRLWEIVK